MSLWQVRIIADAFDKPDTDPKARASFVASLSADDDAILEETRRTPDGDWIEVRVDDGDPPSLWVRAADLVEADTKTPIPVDLSSFVEFSTVAAEDFNSRQAPGTVGVSRDYILALSVALNGLEKSGFKDSILRQFDPFGFTVAEWRDFCSSKSANTNGLKAFDQRDPLAQLDAAIYRSAQATKGLSGLIPSDPASGPYLPNSMDLFLTHVLGPAAGCAIVGDKLANRPLTKPWADYVSASGGDFKAQVARYPGLLDVPGVNTAADLLSFVETKFDDAYVVVSKIISDALPQDAPQLQGDPPWMSIARLEQSLSPPIISPDPRTVKLFEATDYRDATPSTPWCAAFVSWCMKSSGIRIPARADAWAPTWGSWGKPVGAPHGDIPAGAVVIVSPSPETDVASHVGFYAGPDIKDPSRLLLLGGNQGHTIKISSFKRSCVLHIRWPDDPAAPGGLPASAGEDTTVVAIGGFTQADWEKYCDVLGHRESGNIYWRINSIGYAGRWQFGALALADLGYVRTGCPQGLLGNPSVWLKKDQIDDRQRWCTANAVQDNAMLLYTRAHYNQLKHLNVVGDRTPKNRLAGLLAAAHLVGVGGAEDLANGVIRHDANGTTSQQYYNLLAQAFAT